MSQNNVWPGMIHPGFPKPGSQPAAEVPASTSAPEPSPPEPEPELESEPEKKRRRSR